MTIFFEHFLTEYPKGRIFKKENNRLATEQPRFAADGPAKTVLNNPKPFSTRVVAASRHYSFPWPTPPKNYTSERVLSNFYGVALRSNFPPATTTHPTRLGRPQNA